MKESETRGLSPGSESRAVPVFECCLDESGTDLASTTAVLGGLLLRNGGFLWLDLEWLKLLEKHEIKSIHMNQFGPHGELRHLTYAARRDLFEDVAKAIIRHRTFTVAAVVTQAEYKKHFASLFRPRYQMSIYGVCFLIIAVLQSKQAEYEGYAEKIAFLLDDGNEHKGHILNSHEYMTRHDPHFNSVGSLAFSTDDRCRPLQAADVLAWAVRRRRTGGLSKGFEPLESIFEQDHIEQPFEEEWMAEMADSIRKNRRIK